MFLIWIGTLIFAGITLVLASVAWGLVALLRGRPRRYWSRVLWAQLLWLPFGSFVVVPLGLAWFATRLAHTRSDEAGYRGPRIEADGSWRLQQRGGFVHEGLVPPVFIPTADGLTLRAFLVPPRGERTRPTALLAHGLFRGALEIEPVGAMFRDLGCEVLLLELRSHGGSSKALLGLGLHEAADVVAAVHWLRARPGRADEAVLLYGVSLGAAAVAHAAARIPRLAGVVLDAPMDDALATARRMLNLPAKEGRRRLWIAEPWRSSVLLGVEIFAGIELERANPAVSLQALAPEVPVLVIGGGDDQRMPPQVVRQVFERLPTRPERKRLWIRPGSDHGSVFVDDPQGYREHLQWLLR